MNFTIANHFFAGQKIISVKRDFRDPYVWVLAQNNKVYRINSETLLIDDYTGAFSAYNNLQFIDIAGRSKDSVFIATNSKNLIQYKSGNLSSVSYNVGINDTITSVGMDCNRELITDFSTFTANVLEVGTTKGLYRYDTDNDTARFGSDLRFTTDSTYSKVFEATYRRNIFSGTYEFSPPDTITYHTVTYLDSVTEFEEQVWLGGHQFGNHLNTVFFTIGQFYNYDQSFASQIFWGTEKGMFQTNQGHTTTSDSLSSPRRAYLPNIQVNKITDIYGLTTFGNVGTGNYGDIRDNLLVGTVNGLYFSSNIFNHYIPYKLLRQFSLFHFDPLGNVQVNDICVNGKPGQRNPICEGAVWVATDNGLYYLTPFYSSLSDSAKSYGASFRNMADSISKIQICGGTSQTAMVNYHGNIVQWYKNGLALPGATADTLNITTAGEYYAVLIGECDGAKLETNHLTLDITSVPSVPFNYPDKLVYCDSSSVTLQTDYNSSYHYQWYVNDTSTTDTTSLLVASKSGRYRLEVSSCPGSWISTKQVEVDLLNPNIPLITSDKPAYCYRTSARLTESLAIDTNYTINWYRNGNLIAHAKNLQTIITDTSGSYTVNVIYNTISSDGSQCGQTSISKIISFEPPAVVSIQQTVNNTLCQGQTVTLKALYTGGSVHWSTGDNSDQIQITQSGIYGVTLTTAGGCNADTAINVSFLPDPILNIHDTTICAYTHQSVILKAPSGFKSYKWNNQTGGDTFLVTTPKTVNLTIADGNGCLASESIHILESCSTVEIPNTFTPNGDNINDTWELEGLSGDASLNVKIFNRYGTLLYQSKGYYTPWNGTYRGSKLPSGVYYYIINARNGSEKYSGSLTILY